ncbi:MAG: type II toxin-antitoxin system VapC family toxin [Spirochaetes bacterium]|nr:type II toxin-antitoxin system VapC family toxin [Spirochaetota bacterium]
MKYLIDTHILICSLFDPDKIKKNIQDVLVDRDNDIFVSKISLWEITLKYSLGKMEISGVLPEHIENGIIKLGFEIKDLETDEILTYYKLPKMDNHKDPFDRMIIWQCIKNKLILLSRDSRIKDYKKNGLKFLI